MGVFAVSHLLCVKQSSTPRWYGKSNPPVEKENPTLMVAGGLMCAVCDTKVRANILRSMSWDWFWNVELERASNIVELLK